MQGAFPLFSTVATFSAYKVKRGPKIKKLESSQGGMCACIEEQSMNCHLTAKCNSIFIAMFSVQSHMEECLAETGCVSS